MSKEPEYGRRGFIKESVFSLVKTAQEYVKHRDAPSEPNSVAPRMDWLRPPGAVEERLFIDRCTRCGDCLNACPYGSIAKHPLDGFPVIFADESPCHLCDDFPCVTACETDALTPLTTRSQIHMGVAVVDDRACTASQGCHACVSRCPTGALSLDFSTFRVSVQSGQCVGCGLCEQVCRTVNDRIAIKVTPARLMQTS